MANIKSRTPLEWKKGQRRYGSGLTLATAKKMLEAAEKEAERQEVPMSIAITDAGGNLVAFLHPQSTNGVLTEFCAPSRPEISF